jgi:hypothetical protein
MTSGGVERVGTEIQIDSVAVDVGDVWRATGAAAAPAETGTE